MATDFKRYPTLPGNLTLCLIFYSSQQFSYLISPKLLPSFSISVLLTQLYGGHFLPPLIDEIPAIRPSLQLNNVPQPPLPFLGFCPAINFFSCTISSPTLLNHTVCIQTSSSVYYLKNKNPPLPHIPSSGTPHTPHFSFLLQQQNFLNELPVVSSLPLHILSSAHLSWVSVLNTP